MSESLILAGWLLVSHLTADFVLQSDASVAGRSGPGARATRALGLHALVVGLCMTPFWLAFGTPGFIALLVVTVPHPFIDAAKVRLTELKREASEPGSWSPWPAGLFLLDQAVHLTLVFGAGWVLLRDATLNPWFVDGVARATSGIAPADVHRAALIVVVGWSLAVINGRAGRFFVPLVLPPDPRAGAVLAANQAVGYAVKLGPLSGRIEPDRPPLAETTDNVGAVVGILERALVVLLILAQAELAIGLVVAAKTLARFKQLDERPFAEKYLVGTLASVTLAVASGMAARVVLTGI
ncbi:MAG: DUF3307 domain-containing protein [Candidatus Limnocylindrales bacterium]